MDLIKQNKKEIKSHFKWRTRNNEFILPEEMETRHLFFTIRMIWNHSAPANLKLNPYHKYRFNSFYTSSYMKEAVENMIKELKKRKDVKLRWKYDLAHMIYWSNIINLKGVNRVS